MVTDKLNSYKSPADIIFYFVEKTKKFKILKEKKRASLEILQQKFESLTLKDTYPLKHMHVSYENTLFEYLGDDIIFESTSENFDFYRDGTYEEFWLEFSKYVWPGYLRSNKRKKSYIDSCSIS